MTLRVFWSVLSTEARKRMSYRVDFWLTAVVQFFAQLGVSYFIVAAVFAAAGGATVGGYARREMLLYYVAVVLIGKIVRSSEMEHPIAMDIYEGGLSRYLLYPAPYAAFKYAQQLGALMPSLVQLALFGAWVPFVLGVPEGMSIASVAMCAGAVAVASLLQFLLIRPIQAVAFWADNVWSLMVAYRFGGAMLGGVLLPLALFPEWAQRVCGMLPFRFLFAFPVETLLGRVTPAQWGVGLLTALGWCGVAAAAGHIVWRRGDLQYTGVGQ